MFSYKSNLKDAPKFSIYALLTFCAVFALLGIYLIYNSLAADVTDLMDGTFTTSSGTEVIRVWGADRYVTATGLSQKVYADGTAGCVVIALGSDWPDAAISGSLAGTCDGPILLSTSTGVNTTTANEIKRLKPPKIYVVGGYATMTSALDTQLKGLMSGVTVKRLFGNTRYDTAVAVATEVATLKGGAIPDKTVFVVTGKAFPDSLTVGSVSSLKGYPVLYADDTLLPAVSTFIENYGITKTIVIGGTSAVTTTVTSSLPGMVRVSGADRYQTSYNFALYAMKNIPGMTIKNLGVAYGNNYPDALAAGPYLAKKQQSILLLDQYVTKDYVTQFIGAYRSSIEQVDIIGGSSAISNSNYMIYANNMGSSFTNKQVKTQELVDIYVRNCPILSGSTADYGDARGYQAIALYKSARIVISPSHTSLLSAIIKHEAGHIYDWRDNGRVDWGEKIPAITCLTKASNEIGDVAKY